MALQENAVISTTESYKNIHKSVEDLMQFLEQITEDVDNIEIARITTLGAIENISAVLEEIAASTNTVNQTVGEQLLSVESLNSSAGSLDNSAVVLVEAIDKFKV